MEFEHPPQDGIESLRPWIDRLLSVVGHPDAFVTDESRIGDFLEFGGFETRTRRGRTGPWKLVPADPEVRERNETRLASWSAELGFVVNRHATLVETARQLRDLARA